MRKDIPKIRKKVGTAPGSIIYTGKERKNSIKFNAWYFDGSGAEKHSLTLKDLPHIPKDVFVWIQVEGIHDTETIEKIGSYFEIHALLLEDICNIEQGTTSTFLDGWWSLNLRHLFQKENGIQSARISLVTKEKLLISFTESDEHPELLSPIEERLQNKNNKNIKQKGVYYLTYTILDLIVDHYTLLFSILDQKLDDIDESLSEKMGNEDIDTLHELRKGFLKIRKPTDELLKIFTEFPSKLGDEYKSLSMYLRDTNDHLNSLSENIKNNRDKLSSLFDLYVSLVSLDMNKSMQFIGIISVVFLPLTLITGIYGMNFKYMPFINEKISFFVLMGIMGCIFIGILIYLKKKKRFF